MSISDSLKEWLSVTMATASEQDLMVPDDIIQFATPDVLSNHLPPEVMSNVLAASLKAGAMSSDVIVDTVGFDVLSEFIPSAVLWAAIKTVGERAQRVADEAVEGRVTWTATMLREGLRLGLLEPPHIVAHMTPEVMAVEFPHELTAEVLEEGLTGGAFSPEVVVGTVGPERMATHVSYGVLWSCLDERGGLTFTDGAEVVAEAEQAEGEAEDEDEAVEIAAEEPPEASAAPPAAPGSNGGSDKVTAEFANVAEVGDIADDVETRFDKMFGDGDEDDFGELIADDEIIEADSELIEEIEESK